MVDLVSLLNELVDARGRILIPGIYDDVTQLTDEESELYKSIDFSQVLTIYFFCDLFRLFELDINFRMSI